MSKRNCIFHHVRRLRARVGSQIFQAWQTWLHEIEHQSKQIRSNAEQLESLCSDRMAQLYQDKRKSRKQYQEEHAKIASQFGHVSKLDLSIPTRCINKFSEKSQKFREKFQSLQQHKKINFLEWERKFRLFIWTWDDLYEQTPSSRTRSEMSMKKYKSLEDDAEF